MIRRQIVPMIMYAVTMIIVAESSIPDIVIWYVG